VCNSVCFQRAFEPRLEEEIKGIMYGEILGQEVFYNEFDTELCMQLMQLGQCSGSHTNNNNNNTNVTRIYDVFRNK